MALGKIAHLDLLATDLEKTEKYFTEKLGFKVAKRTKHGGGSIWLVAPEGDEIFEFQQATEEKVNKANNEWGRMFIRHIAFEVGDIDKTFEELKSKGVRFYDPKPHFFKPTGRKLAMACDEDGRRTIQLQEK